MVTPESSIPKILHFIWVGGPLPPELSANVYTWFEMHPGWEAKVWYESDIDGLKLQNRALYDRAADIVPRDAVEQFQADIVRYEILALHGGFYADVDTHPLKSIDQVLAGRTEFAAAEDRNWISNTYLGSIPGHALLHELVANLPRNVHRFRGKRPNWLSGPRYLTPIWRARGGYVAPSRQWHPYSYANVKDGTVPSAFDDDVIAVHSWNHTRTVLDNRKAKRRA